MATQSTIEWTEQTWNPTTGCTKVSPGCKNCYAEVMARRLHAMGAPGYENEFKLTVHENRLEQPLLRKKPTTYFVNSMSDLFHEAVSDKFLDRVFSIIETTPHHRIARGAPSNGVGRLRPGGRAAPIGWRGKRRQSQAGFSRRACPAAGCIA
jgi:protein gp37